MKPHFLELFEYNMLMNQKLIELLIEHKLQLPAKSEKLINHILNAQQIWNSRILNLSQFAVWQINNFSDLKFINTSNYKQSLKILAAYDLNLKIFYKNSKGEPFSNSIHDVLFHIINHSTYHRAQIATDLKYIGIEPLNTDFIFYKRKIEI